MISVILIYWLDSDVSTLIAYKNKQISMKNRTFAVYSYFTFCAVFTESIRPSYCKKRCSALVWTSDGLLTLHGLHFFQFLAHGKAIFPVLLLSVTQGRAESAVSDFLRTQFVCFHSFSLRGTTWGDVCTGVTAGVMLLLLYVVCEGSAFTLQSS